MAIQEQQRSGSAYQAALSERVHGTITDLATRLLASPDFMAGLGRTFFGRSFPNGGRARIADGVLFPLGDFKYRADYHAEPLRFSPAEIRTYDASLRLGLIRFDPRLDDDSSTLGRLHLYTHFEEDQDSNVVDWRYGLINLDGKGLAIDDNPDTAFDKIPLIFPELYRTLKL